MTTHHTHTSTTSKKIAPLLSLSLVLVFALTYLVFFVTPSFAQYASTNTASVVLAQVAPGTTNPGGGAGTTGRGAGIAPGGTNPNQSRRGFDNPLGVQGGNLQTFLYALLDKVVIPLGAIVVVFSIILAGYKYITAQGDPKAISAAHQQLTWTAIGAAVLLGAKVLSMVITNTVKSLTS
jgi:predicted membrane protein